MKMNHPKMMEAMLRYEEKMTDRYSSLSYRNEAFSLDFDLRMKHSIKKASLRKKTLRFFFHAAEGLAVAAVFCIVAYAVYIAAQGVRDPIVAGTGETETQTVTETAETVTKETETEVNPNHIKVLEHQITKIPLALEEAKAKGQEEYREFILSMINGSTDNIWWVWAGYVQANEEREEILTKPYYAPKVFEILYPMIQEAYQANDTRWGDEMVEAFRRKQIDFPDFREKETEMWKQNAQKKRVNEAFQRAVNLIIKEKYPSGGYQEFRLISKNEYALVEPYTVEGITVTADNFMDLFLEKNLEYQKEPEFWKKLKCYDSIYFGRYEQDNNSENGAEPIFWQVVPGKYENTLLLVSRYNLDYMPWNTTHTGEEAVYWINSDVRTFLNEEFYQKAFTETEKKIIELTQLENEWMWGSKGILGTGGPETQDYVFLYSVNEAPEGEGANMRDSGNDGATKYAYAQKEVSEGIERESHWERNDNWLRQSIDISEVQRYAYVAPAICISLDF